MTTELPAGQALATMSATAFKGTEKDLSRKIATLETLGLQGGARVLDFGSSWGYGVLQLKAAGYDADGFEVSQTRAAWGIRHLDVTIHQSDFQLPPAAYDAVFTNHVLEHIRNPRAAFDLIATVLRPGGWLVAFVPNGSEPCRKARPVRFHTNWGRLHPVYLTDEFCGRVLATRPHWLASKTYDAPPDLARLAAWDRATSVIGDLTENELMLVALF